MRDNFDMFVIHSSALEGFSHQIDRKIEAQPSLLTLEPAAVFAVMLAALVQTFPMFLLDVRAFR